MTAPDSLNYEAVHRSLLAGLLSRIAQKQEDREYLAARGQKAFVFPGSVLAKKGPPWIMAAELVETARVYARTVARIEPEWAEAIAGDLLKRRHFEPHWEKRQGRVMAYEQVTLYGLILVAKRKLAYEGINPVEAREIFIRSALVEGDADLRAPFFTHNRELIEDVRVLEDKARRRDILVDEEALFAFYAERIPAEVTGLKAFEGWRRDIERQDPKHLFLTRDYLLARADADTAAADDDFPDHIELNGTRFALEYRFEPGHPADGVSLLVPVGLLDEVDEARLGWLVPGLLGEKVEALLKGLPKPLRRLLVPVPDTARALLAEIGDGQGSLLARLSEVLRRRGLTVGPADWDEAGLPAHCRFHIKVLGEKQQLLAEGRDLTALRRQCREQGGAALPQAAGRLEQTGLTDWPAEDIPESVALTVKGMQSRAYPALVEAGSTVDLRLFPTRREAEAAHARGLNALYRLRLAAEFRQAGRRVAGHKALLLHYAPHGRAEALEAMFVTALSDSVFVAGRPLVYTRVAFEQCLSQFRPGLLAEAERLLALVVQVYEGLAAVQRQLEAFRAPVFARAVADIRGQLAALGPADFLARVPVARWQHYPRYLKALALRLDKLPNNVVRDDAASAELAQRWQALQARQAALAARDIVAPALEDYRWLLEEYRVALFAQTVKTAVPVSATRLDKLWQALPA